MLRRIHIVLSLLEGSKTIKKDLKSKVGTLRFHRPPKRKVPTFLFLIGFDRFLTLPGSSTRDESRIKHRAGRFLLDVGFPPPGSGNPPGRKFLEIQKFRNS